MQIAVDTRFWQSEEYPELRDFTREVFGRLAVQHPEHQFIFLSDAALINNNNLPQNVTSVTITPRPANFLLYKWWYDMKVPLTLKKYKADVFIASYGLGSLATSVSQILIIRDLGFLQKTFYSSTNCNAYYKRYTRHFIKKSKRIVTLSDFVKEELVNHYKVAGENVHTIGSATHASFKPADLEDREAVKARYAEGYEYFIFTGSPGAGANLLNVLKAFSIFKKWQKTNMKLVVTGRFDVVFEKELEKLNSYKYRDEVFVKRNLPETETAAALGASYAVIFPSFYEGFAVPVLEAMKCEVPVITSPNSSMSEIAEAAALYANPAKPEDLAQQMKKVFKDEQLRNKLIEAAKQRSGLYNWNKTAALLWRVIEQAVSK